MMKLAIALLKNRGMCCNCFVHCVNCTILSPKAWSRNIKYIKIYSGVSTTIFERSIFRGAFYCDDKSILNEGMNKYYVPATPGSPSPKIIINVSN